ncbi:hypothetical protein TL16_g08927 [Triparma laevis f. inornata]|uniref:CRAL-TRIO domain-containing protein n=2 Tax=Triparma laevis TaxID=1534972 RepID=A0A9W7FFL7_9STRA|nr:hypothetical protein TL16_g08927 [Triparma laevis f. inornata]GMI11260.1 hypothetical protein TrLO_g10473 [Triparma laevis f. longispina]
MIQPATLFQWLLGCPAPLEIATLAITFFSAVAFFSYPKSRPPPLTHKTRSNSNLNGARYTPSPNNPNQQLQPQSSGTFDDLTVNIPAAESSSGQSFERHDEDPPDLETLVMDCRYSVPPDDPKLTDDILIRMLRARDYKVKDAVKMYWRWKGFREEYGIDDITSQDVERLASTKLGYFHGHDKVGRPACVLLPRNYHPPSTQVEEVVKYSLWLMSSGVAQAEDMLKSGNFPDNYDGQVCIIYDRRGMTRKNFDSRLFGLLRTITDIVQICYAERLGKIYVIGTNWFYYMMFKIITPLLSKKTRAKIEVLKEPQDLLKFFDEAQLERERLDEEIMYDKW